MIVIITCGNEITTNNQCNDQLIEIESSLITCSIENVEAYTV